MRVRALCILSMLTCVNVLCFGQDVPARRQTATRTPWTTSRIKGSPEPPPLYRTERVFPRLKFSEPLEMIAVPGTQRLLVAERYGKIYSFLNDPLTDKADLLLDVGKVVYGLAIHPQFRANGQIFVTYVLDAAKEEPLGTRVSRFTVSRDEPWRCDKSTEQIVLEWPSGGHNGGCLRFGPDEKLYVATGDSSGINDSILTGQELGDLSASILRIDIDRVEGARPYTVPSDNPFVGVTGARPEVWAYGLRQPWKMHFDSATGDLWTGNVGQDLWEQIFLIERGGNYGWSVTEGSHAFRPERPRGRTPILQPVVEHDHAEFRSITGGAVYHGKRLLELAGHYIYADYDTGKTWSFHYDREMKKVSAWRELVDSSLRIVGFGEDAAGELYLIDHMGGGLHRLVRNTASTNAADFPRKLSETGLFASTPRHELAAGVLRYSVLAPQWCDGATKERYFALPGESKIEFEVVTYPQPAPGSSPGWRFPDGAVAAETVYLELEAGKPASRRRIETRILHYEQLAGTEEIGDQFWRGYTYVWDDDQTDAELLGAGGADRSFTIKDPGAPGGQRTQTWHFPSRAECTVCHNMAAKYVLGLTTLQLNRDHDYGTGQDHQLRVFEQLGLFTKPLGRSPAELPRLVDYRDEGQELQPRARSYLHANCSHCHRKWGGGNTEFQLLAPLAVNELGIVGTRPAHGGFYLADAEILAPGDPLRSILFYRMAKSGPGRMPRLGSDVVDRAGVALIHNWIASLPSEKTTPTSPHSLTPEQAAAVTTLRAQPPANATGQAAIDQLLTSTRGALTLLMLLDDASLPPRAEVRALAIAAATSSSDAHIRDLFERFLPEEKRPRRLGASIKPEMLLAMKGTADAGRRLFFDTAGIQCRNCHKINGQGLDVGPELSQIGKKYDRAKLLENILEPSREIDPKYVAHLVETRDGRLHTGLLVEKSDAAVVLKDPKNNLLRLNPGDVERITPQQQSLMPDLLLRDMTAEQVADLLEFLAGLK